MGDDRRFQVFADMIEKQFSVSIYKRIADIAGGKGYLQVALRKKGYDVITFDKRKKEKRAQVNDLKFQYRFFSSEIKDQFDLLAGMHPDEATDVIIVEAIRRKIPFIVVPCCVKPYATVLFNRYKYPIWMNHLKNIAIKAGYDVNELHLKISGKNTAIIGRP